MNNSRQEIDEALTIRIQEWPVLERETGEGGVLKRSRKSYRRSRAPTRERDVIVWDIPAPTRVEVDFGLGAFMTFSVKTGRAVGRIDWIIEEGSLKELRKFFLSDEMRAARAIDRVFMCLCPPAPDDSSGALPPEDPANDHD